MIDDLQAYRARSQKNDWVIPESMYRKICPNLRINSAEHVSEPAFRERLPDCFISVLSRALPLRNREIKTRQVAKYAEIREFNQEIQRLTKSDTLNPPFPILIYPGITISCCFPLLNFSPCFGFSPVSIFVFFPSFSNFPQFFQLVLTI